jgi:hypothetical protein
MMRMIARSALAVLSILIVCSCVANDIQSIASADAKAIRKVDHALIELHDEFSQYIEAGKDIKQFNATNPQLRIVDGQVLIDAVASGNTAALENELRALGAAHLSSHGQMVSGFFPITGIGTLAGLTSLKFARPAYTTTRSK